MCPSRSGPAPRLAGRFALTRCTSPADSVGSAARRGVNGYGIRPAATARRWLEVSSGRSCLVAILLFDPMRAEDEAVNYASRRSHYQHEGQGAVRVLVELCRVNQSLDVGYVECHRPLCI